MKTTYTVATPTKSPGRSFASKQNLYSKTKVSPIRAKKNSIHSSPISKYALKQLQSKIKPITITMKKCPYHPDKVGSYSM